MLFLLTGGVQTGKTRWLERLATELAGEGVEVAGVVAPGVWRAVDGGAGGFEKLGIDNVLLPQGERLPFARRRDLALAEGTFDAKSQSAVAQLAWEISDEAIAQVNRHFDEMFHVKHSFAETDVSRETSASRRAGLAVVDELGRLELLHAGGLTSAVALLEAGPSARFPHALAVVRDWLASNAAERFGAAWGGVEVLAPGDEARILVRAAYGLPA